MPIAAERVIQVETVGEGWLLQLLGPALIAVAAILAAGLAAYVAMRNHRDQLAADRALRDQERAREAIQHAAETIAALLDPLMAYEITIGEQDELELETEDSAAPDSSLEKSLKKHAKEVQKTRNELAPRLIKLTADTLSLRISLGVSDPVVKRYSDLVKVFNQRFYLHAPTAKGRTQRKNQGTEKPEIKMAIDAFQDACEAWAIKAPPQVPSRRWWRKIFESETRSS